MNRAPFKRFVITFLLFNKSIPFIVDKLEKFGYQISDPEISDILSEVKTSVPDKYKELIDNRSMFDINDQNQADWLKHFGVFEFYDFIVRKSSVSDDAPEYFKWCSDCMWVHGYKDVMSLVNILLFNKEDLEEISKIIMFKYRKKISVKALELYNSVFWDTTDMTAKEAMYYCIPFRNNALIVRKLRSGNELEALTEDTEGNDGSDVSFTFHDAAYIKWKIGYRNVEVPSPRDFLERVKQDSYFKYYEAMNMTQSLEIEEEEGSNDKIGAFTSEKKKRRNVEEQRVKAAKQWLDIYLKAHESIPSGGGEREEKFFERMKQLSLDFEDGVEKLAKIEDMKEILDDIKGELT